MAEPNKIKNQEDIEKELSVSNFAMQQARTMGFQFGGIAVGLIAGLALAKTSLKGTVGRWWAKSFAEKAKGATPEQIAQVIEHSEETARKWIIPGVSVFIGSTIGGVASLYEHWVKTERERLSVQEINKDVANLMEKRVEFEDTLEKQHTIVSSMLEKYQSTAGQPKTEQLLAERENPAEHARG